jgi:hypothetical protein
MIISRPLVYSIQTLLEKQQRVFMGFRKQSVERDTMPWNELDTRLERQGISAKHSERSLR